MMDKKQVAAVLAEMGTLLELQNVNPFRIRAFQNASQVVESLTKDLEELVDEQRLTEIDGIGQGLAKIITELVKTGMCREYDDLRRSIPSGLLEIIRIPGLGPKRVRLLFDRMKIDSIEALKVAAETGQLAEIPGFGKKTQANILRGIERLRRSPEKHLIPDALESATRILKFLKKHRSVRRCEIAGSLRRRKETIGDIDFVASVHEKQRESVIHAFVTSPEVSSILAQGDTKASVVLRNGINCDLRLVNDSEYAFALNYFTGSKEHNVEMRSLARKKGWSLNEYAFIGLQSKGKTIIPPKCKEEKDIYRALSLSFIPPELREHTGEFEASRNNALPVLVNEKDLFGTFHIHSDFSDGDNSLLELTKAVQKRGWQYWGVADHSQSAVYAKGLTVDRIKTQRAEIAKLQARFRGLRIFHGTECDIHHDGSLDYTDEILLGFDYVIASIHGKFSMNKNDATSRLVKALKNKYVTMIGHPTGRVLPGGEGYPCDIIAVLDAASDYGKAIELNSHPARLELDWRFLRYAKEKGVKVCINPDAHSVRDLDNIQYGVGIARKGWLQASDVVNTRNAEDVEKFFRAARGDQ